MILRKSRKNYEELNTHPCVDKVIFFLRRQLHDQNNKEIKEV